MPKIITRQQAQTLGLTRYFTGQPCKHGHVAERRTDTGNCIACQRLRSRTTESREYMRLYALSKPRGLTARDTLPAPSSSIAWMTIAFVKPINRSLWAALRLIREAVEDCAPPGSVRNGEYLLPEPEVVSR